MLARAILVALLAIGGSACRDRDRARTNAPAPAVRVEVTVGAPGMSAAEVEQLAVIPLERAVRGATGVRHVTAEAREGGARLIIEADGPRERALAALAERVDAAYADAMSEQVDRPVVRDATFAARVEIGVTGAVDAAALGAAAERIERVVERVAGVVRVATCAPREVAIVEIDPARARAVGVTARDVERALGAASVDLPLGGALAVDDLGGIVIATRLDGAPVRLGDVATVRIEGDTRRCGAIGGGGAAAVVAIDVADPARVPEVIAAVDAIGAELPPAVRARRIAHAATVRAAPRTSREDLAAAVARTLAADRAWIAAIGVDAEVCAGAGTRARVYADDARAASALGASPGIVVEWTADPQVRRWWIAGPDLDVLRDVARTEAVRLDAAGRAARAIVDEPAPELAIEPDRDRLAALGLSMPEVVDQVRTALGEPEIAELRSGTRTVPVRLRVARAGRDRLDAVTFTTPDGMTVPLSAVATISETAAPSAICRRDGERAVAVEVRGDDRVDAPLPDGYRWLAPD